MEEWVLMISLIWIISKPGDAPISNMQIDGFASEVFCEAAAKAVRQEIEKTDPGIATRGRVVCVRKK